MEPLPNPAAQTAPPPAPPPMPPVPVVEGDLRSIAASQARCEEALTLLCGKVIALEAKVREAQPLIDQVKAKFIDAKTGKIKFWPF